MLCSVSGLTFSCQERSADRDRVVLVGGAFSKLARGVAEVMVQRHYSFPKTEGYFYKLNSKCPSQEFLVISMCWL